MLDTMRDVIAQAECQPERGFPADAHKRMRTSLDLEMEHWYLYIVSHIEYTYTGVPESTKTDPLPVRHQPQYGFSRWLYLVLLQSELFINKIKKYYFSFASICWVPNAFGDI